MWVGGVGWSQTFINQCFHGIFDRFFVEISGKFAINVPNLMKSVKLKGSVGGFTSLGQLSNQKIGTLVICKFLLIIIQY